MALSPPAPRRHLHTRTISCEGYEREDGLFDIEARIVDQKTYDVTEPFRGHRKAGQHVHDMQLRMTLDRDMVVRDQVQQPAFEHDRGAVHGIAQWNGGPHDGVEHRPHIGR